MLEEIIKKTVSLPEHPQLTGAVGAALYAISSFKN
jgi:activator of 2-hydroxyglutaryl-CoA dehydratase